MGNNVIVLDLEVLNSPDWCSECLQEVNQHEPITSNCPGNAIRTFEKIGWKNHALLGISIGCYFDYADERYHYFDVHTLESVIRRFVERQPLMVSFNGKQFDFPLMWAVLLGVGPEDMQECAKIADAWTQLTKTSYDIFHEIGEVDPINKFQKGNGLGSIALLNGYGEKEMNGAHAPAVWRQGRYAEVVEYCTGDVWKTQKLFEQLCRGEPIKRPAGAVCLPMPREMPQLNWVR